jgi:chromosome segregation ATPase
MLSSLLPLAMLLLTALVAALALYLRAFLLDRFGHSSQVLGELQRSLQERAEQLERARREVAELKGLLRETQAHAAEQIAELQRTLQQTQARTAEQIGRLERTLQETQARTNAEIGELRETLEVQAHRVLSHLAWEEVERYLADESTPDAEKDFFGRLVSRNRLAPR